MKQVHKIALRQNLVLLAVVASTATSLANSEAPAVVAADAGLLSPGEELHFVIKYFGIPGGDVVVRIQQGPKHVPGALVFRADIKTNPAVSTVWRIEDIYLSLADPAGMRTLATRLWEKENGKSRFREELFHDDRVAVRQNMDGQEEHFEVEAPALPRPLDGLAAVWLMRRHPLQPGDVVHLPLFGNRSLFEVDAHVQGIEQISVSGEKRDAIRVEPVIYKNKEPITDAKFTVWLSNDARRLPLLVRSKVVYGRVDFEWRGPES